MEPPVLPALHWRWCHFDQLSVHELDAIYRARQMVFTIEQHCAYLDADGHDPLSHHLAAWSDDRRLPLAYARLVGPGAKYGEPSIGRVLTLPAARGAGLGRELVRRAIRHGQDAFPGQAIRIAAQTRLESFYGSFGFHPVGDSYLEDDIPHTEMLRPFG